MPLYECRACANEIAALVRPATCPACGDPATSLYPVGLGKPRPRALDKKAEARAKLDHYLEERQKAFTRDRKTCRVYDTAAVETHHVIPRSLGGSDDQDNLLSVSKKAHDEFTRNVLKVEGAKNADGPLSIVKWSDEHGGGYVPFKVSAPPDGKAAA